MQLKYPLAVLIYCAALTHQAFSQVALENQADDEQLTDTVVFFDDFTESTLDRSKWNVRIMGKPYNREQQAYVDSEETLYITTGEQADDANEGALVIHPRYSESFETAEGRIVDFTSSRINTKSKFDFTYGSAAARIKMTTGEGIWPAFWLLGNNRWPATGEIDIMEYVGEPDWIGVALHGPGYSGETPFVNLAFFADDTDATDWHVYAVDWSEDRIIFKVDGKTIYRATKTMIENYGKWSYDTPKFLILNVAVGGAYPAKINGVKSPYFGIPESTVQLIRENKVMMLVDWVKVTKASAHAP